MRRILLLLGLVALVALIALLVTRSRATPPALVEAPAVQASAPSALEDANTAETSREPQSSSVASTPAPSAPSVRIHGRVFLEGTRDVVVGAPVQILYRDPSHSGSDKKPSSAKTGPDGSYSTSVPEGALLCEASVLGREPEPRREELSQFYADAYQPSKVDLQLRVVNGDTELDLTVGAGRCLQGLVLERGSERPIAGADLVFDNGINKRFGATSGTDGRFTVRGIELFEDLGWGGRIATLSASHPDYVRAERALAPPDDQGRWADVTLLLEPGQLVEGIVVDAEGKPVSSLELRLRPLHGSPQVGLCEYEGEWKTKSGVSGIFTFPKVPPFDRAWLVTDRQGIDDEHWHGATRTLLHGKDPTLRSLELRLPLEVAVEVDVRYPDGKLAAPDERLLLREDEDGKLRSSREGSRFVCVAGRATRIVAWGKPRSGDADGLIYRGETVVTVGPNGADAHAEVQLASTTTQMRRRVDGERSLGFGAGRWTNSGVTLNFIDRATGLPPSKDTLLTLELRDSKSTGQLGADPTLRLYCEPGWTTMKVSLEGYQACSIEVEAIDNEPQTLTLPLDRLR